MSKYYFERALFIVASPNAGKSTQLRSMFLDARLGTQRNIPAASKLKDMYSLSNERCLYIRLTSPHETFEWYDTPYEGKENFFAKTENKIIANTPLIGKRWNFACPLQPHAANNMPDAVTVISAFHRKFKPERIRVLFLGPDRHGALSHSYELSLAAGLTAIPTVEVAWIDARQRGSNGLLIADFFDFT